MKFYHLVISPYIYIGKYILIMAQNTRSSMLISHIYVLIFTIFLITTVRSNVINYPCIEEATKNHEVEEYNKPSSVTFKDIVSEIGISKKQCKINCTSLDIPGIVIRRLLLLICLFRRSITRIDGA